MGLPIRGFESHPLRHPEISAPGLMTHTLLRRFERVIVLALLVMMVLVVLLATIELGVIIVRDMIDGPIYLLLNIEDMLEIFGFFMMILIGLELIETIKIYLDEDSVHVEIIFLVAIIAITRKVIILDVTKLDPLTLLGTAATILALSAGYFLLKRSLPAKGGKTG